MEMVIGIIALAVGFAALTVGLLTHSELNALREREKRGDNRPATAKQPVQAMSDEQRVQQAVSQRQYANFMNYDGGEQAPIDPATILADCGE